MKALIIGLGSIAKKHIHVLQNNFKELEIFALRSGANKEMISGVINIYSLDELQFIPDFIIISNPTSEHLVSIEKCITFKKPLFIEKPLFNSLDGIEKVVEAVHHNNIKTYTACNLRFLQCLNFVKEYIINAKPVINEVNAYCGSDLTGWRSGTDYKKTYSADKEKGGGVHLDLIHELDYMYWIFGKPVKSSKTLVSKSTLNINATDYANYILEYNNFTASVILNYFRKDAKRTLEIVFSDDTWLIDLLKNNVTSMVTNKIMFTSEQKITDTYNLQINYFINSITSAKPLMNSINESYEVLKICLN